MIGRHKRRTPPAGPCTTARPRGVDHTVRHTDRPAPEGGRWRDLAGSQSDDRPAFPRFRSDAHPLAKVDVEGSNPFSRSDFHGIANVLATRRDPSGPVSGVSIGVSRPPAGPNGWAVRREGRGGVRFERMSRDARVLPRFRYHADPVGTGSIVSADRSCVCCGGKRGYVYKGPVFAEAELHGRLRRWCISDGRAHEKLKASFVDEEGVGGYGVWVQVPRSVVEEVAFRTPSFAGWQQERWFTCCNDAAVFLGPAGPAELEGSWAQRLRRSVATAAWMDRPGTNTGPCWTRNAVRRPTCSAATTAAGSADTRTATEP